MRKVLSFIVCLISVAVAYANDGAFYAEGNHLIPIVETDIRVQKEVLTLNRVDDRIEVTVYYEFFNPVGEKEVLVGFEAEEPSIPINEESIKIFPEHPYMRNFKVVMNGEPLDFEVAHVSRHYANGKLIDTQYYVDGKIQDEGLWANSDSDEGPIDHPLYVYNFNARFRPGLNIIQHTYDFDMADARNGYTKEFFYILTAANRWANHQIDDFTLYVDMGEHTSFHISPTFFKSLDEWEILGVGKKLIGTTQYQEESDSLYKAQYERIESDGTVSKDETYYDRFTPDQRRILKNLPFAYRGYIFNTKELQVFYESTSWYIPNPDYKPDMQQLPDEEQTWVDFWK